MTTPARPAPPILRRRTVESTQGVALTLAAEGAPDRTVVVADHQSAGRGRRGRAWADTPGESLLASILVRPDAAQPRWAAFSPMTAVAVAAALRRTAGLDGRLKWPNDVLAGGRKVAGILLEARGSQPAGRTALRPPTARAGPADPGAIVVGIGINLSQREFPPELRGRATSVALETGSAPDRDAVLAALLEEFDAWRATLEADGFAPVRERWRELCETLGQTVTIDGITGLAVDLDVDGALLVEAHGRVRRVVAGEIESAGLDPAARGRVADAARG